MTTIHFACDESSLGLLLLATSSSGVCYIAWGDDPESLTAELLKRFPTAKLAEQMPQLASYLSQIIAFIEHPTCIPDLPLDIRGTAFQKRVWQALREIPVGATQSYAEIARQMGVPKAYRAVANACAANELAILIPCHRAIRMDGSLSGYYWGVARKAELLRRESEAVH